MKGMVFSHIEGGKTDKMSKYDPLWRYIQVNCGPHEVMTFSKAEEVSDVRIDHRFQYHKEELKKYGFRIDDISWKNQCFEISML